MNKLVERAYKKLLVPEYSISYITTYFLLALIFLRIGRLGHSASHRFCVLTDLNVGLAPS